MNIHLGCWKRVIPGFVNVDLCDFSHIHHKSSIDQLPFFGDETADLIYNSHTLEYFDREQARVALLEWYRVLKPGGTLRLAVPDFEKLIQVYQQTNQLNTILGPLYGRMTIHTEAGQKTLYHKTVYDESTLTETLLDCGYEEIQRYNWRDTIHKDYDDHSQAYFPHMDKETGLLISLNLEAKKL